MYFYVPSQNTRSRRLGMGSAGTDGAKEFGSTGQALKSRRVPIANASKAAVGTVGSILVAHKGQTTGVVSTLGNNPTLKQQQAHSYSKSQNVGLLLYMAKDKFVDHNNEVHDTELNIEEQKAELNYWNTAHGSIGAKNLSSDVESEVSDKSCH
ncbi:hypothetical protein C8R41DRAFT_903390 [Lentinula lateritia]|uniref:Uncharacterized protein n=1 Tax=Lentinula lateritia TaxID=40482 RepID=A0ABQ8VDF3_9AGAR|nr:hypothetical protein C8R41DRAFT_903390 [Lentinula lateritia]